MLVYVIIACEVAFWLFIAAGLTARYALKWKRVGAILLLSTPVLDLTLLAVSIVDVRSGGEPGLRHALAAVYLGYTVVFGHRTVKWADAKAAHLFGQGPPPPKPPRAWLRRFRYELKIWFGIVAMYAIAWAVTGLFVLIVGDAEATEPLVEQMLGWGAIVGIAALVPLSYLLFPSSRSSRDG
ncbi:hypothetical protein GCM10027447_34450 [Glycomyces halotolerans]